MLSFFLFCINSNLSEAIENDNGDDLDNNITDVKDLAFENIERTYNIAVYNGYGVGPDSIEIFAGLFDIWEEMNYSIIDVNRIMAGELDNGR